MKRTDFIVILLIPILSFGGTITTTFTTLGSVVYSSGTAAQGAGPSFVQFSTFTYQTGNSRTTTSSFTVTAANLLMVGCVSNPSCTQTVTDSLGNSYTDIGMAAIGGESGANDCLKIWYAKNISGGTNQVTCKDLVNFSSGLDALVLEYTGASLTNPFDVYSSTSPSSAVANPVTASTTTTASNAVMVGFLSSFAVPSGAAGSTVRVSSASAGRVFWLSAEDKNIPVSAATVSSWTAASQFDPFLMGQAAIK